MPVLAASRADWYLTRSTGTVALLLLTGIVILGLLGPLRVGGSTRWPRFTIGALHRDLSLLALAVLAVHIVTAVLDTFAPIGWLDAVIPLHSRYRPVWLGLGACAFDLLVALLVTSLIRRRLGYARWRAVHWLSYACWPLAAVHGLGTGSDAGASWMTLITVGCIVAVAGAVALRASRARIAEDRGRMLLRAAPVGVAAAILGFALVGPWQPGWAAKAGTPPTLLHTGSGTHPAPKRFIATVAGRERRRAVPGGALLDFSLTLRGAHPGTLRIRLAGRPRGAGVSLVGAQVDLSAATLGGVFQGGVTRLSGSHLDADLRQVGGAGWRLHADLVIASRSRLVSGRIAGTAL